MSVIGSNILAGAAGSGVSAYEIEQSLRFNSADSAYLNRTPSSAGNRKTWTWSAWIKSNSVNTQRIFQTGTTLGTGNYFGLSWQNSGKLFLEDAGGFQLFTTALHRDPSAWYHIVVAVDTTQATSTNRIKLYVNGVQRTSFSTESYPGQNTNTSMNNTVLHYIGAEAYEGPRRHLDGYLAEINLIDGSALDPEDFGEFDDNGVWRPIEYAGSYTGNSFYLKFDAADVDGDSSGLGNDWTANNISTSGTGTDVMFDTPTTNYATLNPLRPSSYGAVTLSNGNLNASQSTTAYEAGTGTIGVSSGKWYWEVDCNSVGFVTSIGITKDLTANGPGGGQEVYTYHYDGKKYVAGVLQNYSGNSYTSGDLLGFALDLDAGTLVAYKNGTSQGTLETGLSGTFYPYVTLYGTRNVTFNFGQTAFQQTVPTGYSALNTANLPAPDIADGSEYFQTVLYTGTGVDNHAITGVGFQPDWVWLKTRSVSDNHVLQDVVRGAQKQLFTNNTDQELSATTQLKSFDSDGFTLGTDSGVNGSGRTFAAWNWKAGGTGSSNTDGSITSTVSANPTAGFSIGTYTADGSNANRTVGHGLGVAPEFIIVKNRDTSGRHWLIWHKGFNDNDKALLFTDAAVADNRFGPSAPTSTVFGLYGGQGNYNSDDHVFYAFAGVEGYSKFGGYSGGDGVFVYLGFKPALLITKGTLGTRNWNIHDSTRSTYNVVDDLIHPNLNVAESAQGSSSFDFVSNGFVQRGGNISGTGDLVVYAAFAENPFGGRTASPATAR